MAAMSMTMIAVRPELSGNATARSRTDAAVATPNDDDTTRVGCAVAGVPSTSGGTE